MQAETVSTSTLVTVGPGLAVAVVLLALLAALVSRLGGLGHGRQVLVAVARAAVQLAVVAVLIGAMLRSFELSLLFVAVMAGVATRTAGRRLTHGAGWWWAGLPLLAGVAPVVIALLASGLVPRTGLAVIPVSGILLGGAMTATSLAGRSALDELLTRRGELEAALALGFLERDAALLVCRDAASKALVPALDQTRTVGLVTLPGAFVGLLLAGASPVAAGAVQVFVLAALLAVEAVAVIVVTELVALGRWR